MLQIQQSFKNKRASLFLIVTPIGNLQDFSFRSIATLQQVNTIFCEDTRVTKKLLNHFEVTSKQLISVNNFNEKERINIVLKHLQNGEDIALLSDAGYPLISDPGYYLVSQIVKQNFNVIAVGANNAGLNALICSGIKPYPFIFQGFLEHQTKDIVKTLESLKYYQETLGFYISVHRLEKTLQIMWEIFGNRQVCLARELTKIYETFYRGTLGEILTLDLKNLKGEFVLIVEGSNNNEQILIDPDLSLKEQVYLIAQRQNLSIKAAIKEVAAINKIAASLVYQAFHK